MAGKPRHDYPMAIEINKRLENVATDQKLRTGKEVHPRRSDFVEWYYIYIFFYESDSENPTKI